MNKLCLEGVRIVDFSWVLAGPMATKMLGAMGAEVIKIESTTRMEFADRGGFFSIVNQNKRSCTLNIKDRRAQDLLKALVSRSDVVVENFSSRVLASCGLSYEELRKVRPDLIFVSASGLGRTGPERDYLAYGSLLQAYSGRVQMIASSLHPSLEAMGVMPAWTDPITALWEVFAVMAALHHRRRTGEGAYIDLSMLESTVALLPRALLGEALGREPLLGTGLDELDAAPSGCFRCAGEDEWLALSVTCDRQWAALCAIMERPDLGSDEALRDGLARGRAKDELNAAVASWLRGRSAADTEARLWAAGVPAARSRSMVEVVGDGHFAERGTFTGRPDDLHVSPLPWLCRGDGWRGRLSPTPEIGADNDYVFREILDIDEQRVAELRESGVIR